MVSEKVEQSEPTTLLELEGASVLSSSSRILVNLQEDQVYSTISKICQPKREG